VNQTIESDVVIIGGGAAGLMCAGMLGQRGMNVRVLDRANKVGKKILMSGGGRCNFTNLYVSAENYLSANPHFCKSALSRYTQWDFIALVEKHRIPYHERKHGELFCDNSSKEILRMLLDECAEGKVDIRTHCTIDRVAKTTGETPLYLLQTNQGRFVCRHLVVATGGLSIPTMGASSLGYDIAQQFDLKVLPRRAGLVPFTFTDATKGLTERLSGLALDVNMHCQQAHFRENMLFTHRGISGPSALQVSSYWQEGEMIEINLLPDIDVESWLLQCKQEQPKSLLRSILASKFSKAFTLELQHQLWTNESERPIGDFRDDTLRKIAQALEQWRLKPSGTEGYRTAEVTLGGVDTNELSSRTMESKTHTGLYFIGEVVDVTGHLGGFNFQWAWSSAFAAASAIV